MKETKPFAQILTNWMPSSLDPQIVEAEFGALMRGYGIEWDADSSIAPRSPARNRRQAWGTDSTGWHKDGHDGHYPYALVFWSNRILPDIKDDLTGKVLETSHGDVVLVRNRIALHKTPLSVRGCLDRLLCQAWLSHAWQMGEK